MAGRGRPSEYTTKVKPHLKEIEQMVANMTQKQMCDELGISVQSFCKYKKEYKELQKALDQGKKQLVIELKECLIKKAKGYTAVESKKKYEYGKLVEEVVTEKHYPADIGAINLLLKNLDKDNWANDPQNLAIRREELELKREIAGKEQTVIPVQIINDIPRPEVSKDDECNADTSN